MEENNIVNFTPFNDVEGLNNKRKLKIISQTPSEMVVEIERVAIPNEMEQTNAINASTLNSRFTEMANTLNSALNEKTGTIVRVKNSNGEYNAMDVNFDSDPQTQINERVKYSDLLNKIYPIGSIYISTVNTSPNDLFGGTWVQLQDKFLIGAGNTYELGTIGGEASHTLTTDEIPSHTHTQNAHTHTQLAHHHKLLTNNIWSSNAVGLHDNAANIGSYTTRGVAGVEQSGGGAYYAEYSSIDNNLYVSTEQPTINTTIATNQNTGGGQAHNNMPPYLAVFMWKRIA